MSIAERHIVDATYQDTIVSDQVNRFRVVAHRRTYYGHDYVQNPVILHRVNKIKLARGLVKQETNSHMDMLLHHDLFDLHFTLDDGEDQKVLSGYDDLGMLRYKYTVWIEDNA